MYNAFCYGAPPHAGIAPGVDRMVMLLAGEDSIREVIPFPMNKNAQDLMMDAPSAVDPKQLADVHIAIVEDSKQNEKKNDPAANSQQVIALRLFLWRIFLHIGIEQAAALSHRPAQGRLA